MIGILLILYQIQNDSPVSFVCAILIAEHHANFSPSKKFNKEIYYEESLYLISYKYDLCLEFSSLPQLLNL